MGGPVLQVLAPLLLSFSWDDNPVLQVPCPPPIGYDQDQQDQDDVCRAAPAFARVCQK